MDPDPTTSDSPPVFRPRARLLQLLGDELIGNPRLAVFELVKNSYDACARKVTVKLEGLNTDSPWIEVRDNGDGMTFETLRDVWLVLGHDHRKQAREEGRRSHCGRLPLGEKGLGRFAAHKLGNKILLVTRSAKNLECVVDIDWEELTKGDGFLSDRPVEIQKREPEIFTGSKTGTLIRIDRLRPPEWTRGEVRRLHRQVISMCSPFELPEDFSVELAVPGMEHWIRDVPQVQELLERALWYFRFSFDGKNYSWRYEFRPLGLPKLEGRILEQEMDQLLIEENREVEAEPTKGKKKKKSQIAANEETLSGIGRFQGEIYVYDRDREVLLLLQESQLLQSYLDEQGGLRIYRDGIRVYNYGEPGDDWLGLDLRRVNIPTKRLSRNLILGALHLRMEESFGLIEKTNREGFVENEAFRRLQRLVIGMLATLERERLKDKDRIRLLLDKRDPGDRRGIEGPLEDLKKELKEAEVYERCERLVLAIEKRYREMQDDLLQPAVASLNLSLIFHEVERGVRELLRAVQNRENPEHLERQARDMAKLLDDFSQLLRRHGRKKQPIAKVVDQMRRINLIRFKVHQVILDCDVAMDSNPGFEATFSHGLILGALNNLIDNAIYWLRVRWAEEPDSWESSPRRLCIRVSRDLEGGPCLIVADTGPGFRDNPEDLVRPFFTRRPEGMGLGLYYTNLVMELSGGRLLFPERDDVALPKGFDGAVIALQFPEAR
jgi:signal transduction histidine kinase